MAKLAKRKKSYAFLVFLVLVVIGAAVLYYYPGQNQNSQTPSSLSDSCQASGGAVTIQMACAQASDFPNTCSGLIGWAGCAPMSSSPHKYCDCGPGKCFDETECVQQNQTQSQTTSTSTASSLASCNDACVALSYKSGTCRASCYFDLSEKSVTTGNDCATWQKCCCKK